MIFYRVGKASYRFIAKLFGVSPSSKTLDVPKIAGNIREIEFDEIPHFINSKKQMLDSQSSFS